MSAPSITITRLDLQRLERVLASLQDVTPGVEALEQELARACARGGEFLRAQGDARMMRTEPIVAMRGMLRDRNGVPLAVSTPVTTLWMNPRQAIAAGADIGKLAKALGQSPRDLSARVQRNRSKGFIYLKRHLSPTDAEGVLALDIPGVFGMTEYRRFYPEGEATAHLLGFTDLDDHGKEGLELAFDEARRNASPE